MSQAGRMAFAVLSTIGLAALAIVYYRVGVANLFPLANDGGPFSWIIGWVTTAAPLAIVALLLAVWAWAFASPVQDEAAIKRYGP